MRFRLALVPFLALAILPACGGDDEGSGETSYLFVVDIVGGEISGDGTSLTVEPDAAGSVWFTDRPDRLAGALDVADLVDAWGDFGDDPPNAALVLAGDDALALELQDATLGDDGSVTWTIAGLDSLGDDHALGDLALTELEDQTFRHASLFIDDVSNGVCGSGGGPFGCIGTR